MRFRAASAACLICAALMACLGCGTPQPRSAALQTEYSRTDSRRAAVSRTERRADSRQAVEPESQPVTIMVRTTESWDGALLPRYPDNRPQITMLRVVVPPGRALRMHRSPFINAGYMVRGSLTITTEIGAQLFLNAGETVVNVVNTWQYARNEGDVPAEMIIMYAGTEYLPITEQRSAEEAPDAHLPARRR